MASAAHFSTYASSYFVRISRWVSGGIAFIIAALSIISLRRRVSGTVEDIRSEMHAYGIGLDISSLRGHRVQLGVFNVPFVDLESRNSDSMEAEGGLAHIRDRV